MRRALLAGLVAIAAGLVGLLAPAAADSLALSGAGYGTIFSVDLAGQTANFASQTAITSAAAGFYRITCQASITTAAATSSNTPNCNVSYSKDFDTGAGGGMGFFQGSANNIVGFGSQPANEAVVHLAATSTLVIGSASYASNPASTMTYTMHIRVTYLGQ